MTAFEVGAVYRFNYLWAREHERGEESGRKSRPACLLFRTTGRANRLYMFPITSQPPAQGREAQAVSEAESQAAGLQHPCWILLDEVNVTLASRTYDFDSLQPLGRFSEAFLRSLITVARDLAVQGKLAPVPRT